MTASVHEQHGLSNALVFQWRGLLKEGLLCVRQNVSGGLSGSEHFFL